jgi:hypothetical protein
MFGGLCVITLAHMQADMLMLKSAFLQLSAVSLP